jgi:hypothetical protein
MLFVKTFCKKLYVVFTVHFDNIQQLNQQMHFIGLIVEFSKKFTTYFIPEIHFPKYVQKYTSI